MEQPKILFKQHLDKNPDHYLALWKWFQEDAAKIKDKMWTIATFFYTLLGTILGYTGKQYAEKGHFPDYLLLVTLIGCFLGLYGTYMLYAYGSHIKSSWSRADHLLARIEGLGDIWFCEPNLVSRWKFELPFFKGLPSVAKRLIYLMLFFLLLYLVLALFILVQVQKVNPMFSNL